MPQVTEPNGLIQAFDPGAIPIALLWLGGAIVGVRLLTRLLQSVSERFTARRLLLKQLGTLIAFGAYAAAFILAFNSLFHLSSEMIFALSGTLAVTIGFALKDVAASFLAGITILISKPFQVGDRVSFSGYYGEVVEIGLRTVRLVTLDDNLVTVPSNKFLTDPVASANAGALDCMVVMDFYISPESDHERARRIVLDAVVSSKFLYLGKPFTVLVNTKLSEQGRMLIELKAKAYVFDTRREKDFVSDVNRRVLTAFRDNAVSVPF